MSADVRFEWRCHHTWWQTSEVTGELIEVSDADRMPPFDDETTARRAHTAATEGLWVRPHMVDPHVSDLVKVRLYRAKSRRGRSTWREDIDSRQVVMPGGPVTAPAAIQETLT